MTEMIVRRDDMDMAMMESVVVGGDLSKLSPEQRLNYYKSVCDSVGLNPLTRPFDYIVLNGKMTLYAKKDATDQLRQLKGISISKPEIQFLDDILMVSVTASDVNGRNDSDVGVVAVANLKGDNKANAIMKAITKAKRRVTLSIAGLGWLDETEIETIPSVQPVMVDQNTGEILMRQNNGPQRTQPAPAPNRTAQHRNAPQRPANPARKELDSITVDDAEPLAWDDGGRDAEWQDMAAETDANAAADKKASAPFVWPVGMEALELCTGLANHPDLPKRPYDMANYFAGKSVNSDGPMTDKQYQYLVSLVDKRYDGGHNAILSALCGHVVHSENKPGFDVKELLDWLIKPNENITKVKIFDEMVEFLKADLANFELA